MQNHRALSRRDILQAALTQVFPGSEHSGKIKPPVPAPDIALLLADGSERKLVEVLRGHGTALQMMFTECETTCPMQGAIFERVQVLTPGMADRQLQLVSLSIDPRHDTPQVMRDWLRRFHAGENWVGVAPLEKDLAQVKEFFGRGRSASDDHSTQIHIFNLGGLLVWRTAELPSAEEISGILQKL